MTYASDDFWKQYDAYVVECFPRHKRAVDMLCPLMGKVLDLGCGKVMEGSWLTKWPTSCYFGVDQDPGDYQKARNMKADYRTDLGLIRRALTACQFEPDTVMSLFSIEPTGDDWLNEGLYNAIFIKFPYVKRIISAGFYYEDRDLDQWVKEVGGLQSHQTNQCTPMLKGNLRETRMYQHAPSQLFGSKVVEAWRLIERNPG